MSTSPPSDYVAETVAYYDAHAAEFCESTVSVDMKELYDPFLREIPAGGRILDAGCGSGRDSLAFLQKGYQVIAIDASVEMVHTAKKLTGLEAKLLNFDSMDFDREFDGIWACASLLHVSRRELNPVLARFTTALKPSGVLYLSFKHGDAERVENGRFFNDLDEPLLMDTLSNHPQLELVRIWTSEDTRNDRRGRQPWLNAIVRRGLPYLTVSTTSR